MVGRSRRRRSNHPLIHTPRILSWRASPTLAAALERLTRTQPGSLDVQGKFRGLAVTVVGYTSREEDEAYNDDLSQRRSEAVVAALVARGLDAGRLSADGRGENQPIADNATEAGRSLNRRVEIACSV